MLEKFAYGFMGLLAAVSVGFLIKNIVVVRPGMIVMWLFITAHTAFGIFRLRQSIRLDKLREQNDKRLQEIKDQIEQTRRVP